MIFPQASWSKDEETLVIRDDDGDIYICDIDSSTNSVTLTQTINSQNYDSEILTTGFAFNNMGMSDDKRIIVFLHNTGNRTRMYYSLRQIDGTYSNPTRITTGFDDDSYFDHSTYGARGLAISGDGKVIAINSNSSANVYGGLGIFVDTSSTSTPTFTLRKKIHRRVVASNGVTINSDYFGKAEATGNNHGAALSFDGSVIVTTNGSSSVDFGNNNYILYSDDSWNTFNAEEVTGAQTKSVAITSNGTIVLKDKNNQ